MNERPLLGPRRLYAYWRVTDENLRPALDAVGQWQRTLTPGNNPVAAELHQRSGPGAAVWTVMEVYGRSADRAPAGLDTAWIQRLTEEGDAVTQPWRQGARHVEVFDQVR